jgi:hypothetical protein
MTGTSLVGADDGARITIESDGHAVATATVADDDGGAAVRVSFSIDHGHLPMQVRRRLLDAVFEVPAVRESRVLRASIPLGDVDLLNGMRAHCAQVDTRAAGSTCLVDAVVAAQPKGQSPDE